MLNIKFLKRFPALIITILFITTLFLCSLQVSHAQANGFNGKWSGRLIYGKERPGLEKDMNWTLTVENSLVTVKSSVKEPDGGSNKFTAQFAVNDSDGAFITGSNGLWIFSYLPNGENSEIRGQLIRRQFLNDGIIESGKSPVLAKFALTKD